MIKKTFKTLKNYPKIVLLFMIPFVYALIRYTILSDTTIIDAIYTGDTRIVLLAIFTGIISFCYFVGWMIFLQPPLMHYIYEVVDNKVSEGWYMRGLRGYWWRSIVITLLMSIALTVVILPFCIVGIILYAITQSLAVPYIGIGVLGIVLMVIVVFVSIGNAAVFAEEDFGKGLHNIFKAGKKHFFKLLFAAVIMYIPTAIVTAIAIKDPNAIYGTPMIISSFFGSLIGSFFSVFCMHCYVDYKKGSAEMIEQNKD